MKLGLRSISKLLDAIDLPQNRYEKVQVAGTNGKGSVCAFLYAICRSAGIRAGLYTSPHLISITERIRIDGSEITPENFARHASRVRETSERLVRDGAFKSVPTYFEQVTAVALSAFAEAGIRLAILETGLGGRYDATTAARAEIAAITRIDLDHQKILGDSLPQIAAEKAAIIRKGSKVVVGDQVPEAMDLILARCDQLDILPKLASSVTAEANGDILTFRSPEAEYTLDHLALRGRHQLENAKVAILLAETLGDGFAISVSNVEAGLRSAEHPGRLELHGDFLFDGAHNTGGARALREYLEEYVNSPVTMIFGAMSDKDVSEIAEILFPKAETLILTRPDNPRSASPDDLARLAAVFSHGKSVYKTATVREAIAAARGVREEAGGIICVTGSLYLVGEVQKILKSETQI
jgi:dihydrofolate synthase/folylpolyglutamate synthase